MITSRWELVHAEEEQVRRIAVPGGWLYQVQRAREYIGHPSNNRWEPVWHPPYFIPNENAVDWQARALAAEARCQQYQDALAEESGRLLAQAALMPPISPGRKYAQEKWAEIKTRTGTRAGWLAQIEALMPGDACEFRAGSLGWLPGTVVVNGSGGYWTVRDNQENCVTVTGIDIEQIRLPGQTEAWP